jgi:hypothetical protein
LGSLEAAILVGQSMRAPHCAVRLLSVFLGICDIDIGLLSWFHYDQWITPSLPDEVGFDGPKFFK